MKRGCLSDLVREPRVYFINIVVSSIVFYIPLGINLKWISGSCWGWILDPNKLNCNVFVNDSIVRNLEIELRSILWSCESTSIASSHSEKPTLACIHYCSDLWWSLDIYSSSSSSIWEIIDGNKWYLNWTVLINSIAPIVCKWEISHCSFRNSKGIGIIIRLSNIKWVTKWSGYPEMSPRIIYIPSCFDWNAIGVEASTTASTRTYTKQSHFFKITWSIISIGTEDWLRSLVIITSWTTNWVDKFIRYINWQRSMCIKTRSWHDLNKESSLCINYGIFYY